MINKSDVHRPREEATAVTPTTPYSEDPPGSSLTLGRLTAAPAAVRSAGLPAAGFTAPGAHLPGAHSGQRASDSPGASGAAADALGAVCAHGVLKPFSTPARAGISSPPGAAPGAPDSPGTSGAPSARDVHRALTPLTPLGTFDVLGVPDGHAAPDRLAGLDSSGAPDAYALSGAYGGAGHGASAGGGLPAPAQEASGGGWSGADPAAVDTAGPALTGSAATAAGAIVSAATVAGATTAGLTSPGATAAASTPAAPATPGPTSLGPTSLGPTSPGPTSLGPTSPGPTSLGPTSPGPTADGTHPDVPSDAGGATAGGVPGTAPATQRFERQFSGAGGRRTVVIGTETTGAIPVHLLYRDAVASAGAGARGAAEKTDPGGRKDVADGAAAARPHDGTTDPAAAGWLKEDRSGPGADGPRRDADGDGGPDTIAMPAVALPAGRRSAPNAGRSGRRAVPPPDPRLTERPGPVLPGWAALLAGALSLVGCVAVLHWAGAFPPEVTTFFGLGERPYAGLGFAHWVLLAVSLTVALFTLGGLARGKVGHAWVLTLYGEYRGTVRRSGLLWVSPLLLRRRVDVRLRHWRSEPMPSVDADGTALEAVVLVVWRVRDTARAVLGLADHESYLREQVEAALPRVFSRLPADASAPPAGGGPALELRPTLRNAEAVGDALTKTLAAECAPVGIDVFSVQPTRIEYAPEVAAAMRRCRVAVLEAERRDTVLGSVVDAVDDTVQRLTLRGLVEFDDYERKALVRDLTVAFCTARTSGAETP
ncbi:hypothetical protein DDQ41_07720 [Streptomyces spongiicola]|uniref:Band 7 domain-containing protein n=1 Tax=Streptomyces spongiicola TaxID=1690221 RepID=A0ABN5KP67_9ACTN|nr:hypothetical protein DDQ41_07720 [Streptomyces spongiicola]